MLSDSYAKDILGEDFSGFSEFVDRVVEEGSFADFHRAHFPSTTRGRFCIFESMFVDKLALLNVLDSEHASSRGRRGANAPFEKIFSEAGSKDVQPMTPLLVSSGEALSAETLRIIASAFGVRFFDEAYARKMLHDAGSEVEPDIDWLISVVAQV